MAANKSNAQIKREVDDWLRKEAAFRRQRKADQDLGKALRLAVADGASSGELFKILQDALDIPQRSL